MAKQVTADTSQPAADATPSWAAMYNAFQTAMGVTNQNFQLIMPFSVWNWPVESLGQTYSAQQSFLDAMPIWSPVGNYQSGSSFASAYLAWLYTLMVEAPAALQNRITQQRQLLQSANNQYSTDYQTALQAYNSDPNVKNNVPAFPDWLNSPAGFAYNSTLTADKNNVNTQASLYSQLTQEAQDPALASAIAASTNKSFFTGMVSSSIPTPISVPGYGQITDFATWVQQNAGTGPTKISWSNSQSSSTFNDNWAQASASISDWFFSIYVKGSWQRITDLETSSDVEVTISMNPMGSIPISPLPWYNEGFVNSRINNPDAYIPGTTPTKGGAGAWVMGQGGIMPCRVTDFLIGYQPSFSISSSSGFSQSDYQQMEIATGVRIGPFTFGGDAGSTSSYQQSALSTNGFSGVSTSTFPVIFGIYLELFGQT
jgi:hypothetical protein